MFNYDYRLTNIIKHAHELAHENKNKITALEENTELNNKLLENLTFSVEGRRIFRKNFSCGIFDSENSDNNYANLQGNTVYNNHVYICLMPRIDTTHTDKKNNIDLRKYDMQGNFISHNVIVGGGHANTLASDDKGYLYLCVCNTINDNSTTATTGSDSVIKIDADTLEVIQTYNTGLQNGTKGVTYNKDDDTFLVYTKGDGTLYHFNNNFTQILKTVSLEDVDGNNELLGQGMTYNNGLLYSVFSQNNCVICHDIETGKLNGIYNVGSSLGGYPVGEIEDITIIDNTVYIGTGHRLGINTHLTQVQFFKAYFNTKGKSDGSNSGTYTAKNYHPDIAILHVNKSQGMNNNPDGQSTNAFYEIIEAVEYAVCNYANNCRIVVDDNSEYAPVCLTSGNMVEITGDANNKCNIHGLYLTNGAKLMLTNVKIDSYYYYRITYGYNRIQRMSELYLSGVLIQQETRAQDGAKIELSTGCTFSASGKISTSNGLIVSHISTISNAESISEATHLTKTASNGIFIGQNPIYFNTDGQNLSSDKSLDVNFKFFKYIVVGVKTGTGIYECKLPTINNASVKLNDSDTLTLTFNDSTMTITSNHTGTYKYNYIYASDF